MYNILIKNNRSKVESHFSVNPIVSNVIVYKPEKFNCNSELDIWMDTTRKEIEGLNEVLCSIKRENEAFMNYPFLVGEVLESVENTIYCIEEEIKRLEGLVVERVRD